MISSFLHHRSFVVHDCGHASESRPQQSGVSQGCTLSPLLFILLMTVLLQDSLSLLSPEARAAYDAGELSELVYADDTMLLACADEHLEEYLRAVQAAGRDYGLELHMGKSQLMSVNSPCRVRTPQGPDIPTRTEMVYLGTVLCSDGTSGKELSRRIGMAKATFSSLATVGKHASLTQVRKLELYKALVESRLLYSLCALCLTVAELRRLDGFQNKCLRVVLGIKPSFVSRVRNVDVLQQARHLSASMLLQKQQLQLLGKILRTPEGHPLRIACFIRGSLRLVTDEYIRRRGRPRKEWVPTVMANAMRLFGSPEKVQQSASNKYVWSGLLSVKFMFHPVP